MFSEKVEALVAEGLTPGEARYLASDGRDDSGLDRSVMETGSAADAEPSPPARSEHEAAPQERDHDTRFVESGAELRDLRERNARLDERMRIFKEAFDQSEAPQPRRKPDRDADPFGYMAYQDEQIDALRSRMDQFTSQAQERAAVAELTNTFRQDAHQYAAANPDFGDPNQRFQGGAYAFLLESRDRELQAAGYRDAKERARIIAADERDIVARAFHARQQDPRAPGPSEVLHSLARARGFTGRGSTAQRGAAPAPAQQGGFDLERIAALTDSQYEAWKRTLTPQQRKAYSAALGYA